jgi:hypothetical protein
MIAENINSHIYQVNLVVNNENLKKAYLPVLQAPDLIKLELETRYYTYTY